MKDLIFTKLCSLSKEEFTNFINFSLSSIKENSLKNFKNMVYAIYNEDIRPNIESVSSDTLESLWKEQESLGNKEVKLQRDYVIRVFHSLKDSTKISYKNEDNIIKEISRLLTDEEKDFLKDNFEIIDSDIAGEFLCINNIYPNYITNKENNKIILYSALLNFSKMTDSYLEIVFNICSLNLNVEEWVNSWEEKSKIFREILRKLSEGTIHY